MAPIETDLHNDNTKPYLLLGAYTTFTASLVAFIGHRVIYRSYRALPPSQATRRRQSHRLKHVSIFGSLTLVSLILGAYYLVSTVAVSYQVWAYERGDPIPTSIWGDNGIFNEDGSIGLQLGRWLRDTNVFGDSWEIAMSNSRRQWWTQQLFLARAAWSLYAAIDSRRRNVPHIWAFILLVGLVSLSFAQNLYALTVLLTPVPLQDSDKHSDLVPHTTSTRGKHGRKASRSMQETAAKAEEAATSIPHRIQAYVEHILPPKPVNWVPHPLLYSTPLIASTIVTILTGLATNTTSFHPFVLQNFLILFLPALIIRVAPARFGNSGSSTAAAGNRAINALRFVSIVSFVLHLFKTFIAVLDNDESRHRHYYFFRDNRSALRHAGSSLGRVLGAFADHPACGQIAWDVILSGLTLVVWAGVRGVSGGDMLRAAGWATRREIELVEDVAGIVRKEVKRVVGEGDEYDNGSPTTSRPRSRKSVASRKASGTTAAETDSGETGDMAKSYADGGGNGSWTGDEDRREDWEISALAWGLLVLGGLGVASSSVLGAELV